jgi:hypothetical protein
MLGAQVLQEVELVQLAFFLQELRTLVRYVRPWTLAARDLTRERGQMPAADVVVEVGRRKQDPPI